MGADSDGVGGSSVSLRLTVASCVVVNVSVEDCDDTCERVAVRDREAVDTRVPVKVDEPVSVSIAVRVGDIVGECTAVRDVVLVRSRVAVGIEQDSDRVALRELVTVDFKVGVSVVVPLNEVVTVSDSVIPSVVCDIVALPSTEVDSETVPGGDFELGQV
eukprot:PhM_4_TR15239/c0_g1_i1/m.104994